MGSGMKDLRVAVEVSMVTWKLSMSRATSVVCLASHPDPIAPAMMHCRLFPFTVRRIAAFIAAVVAVCAPAIAKPFVHPGLLHTEADFVRMRAKVEAGEEPWLSGWKKLEESRHAQLGYHPRPLEIVLRGGPGQNFPVLFNDIHAAYQLALRWKVSGDRKYAEKSIEILNAWSEKLKAIEGNANRFLAAGIYGYQFANAAEIMRTYRGWQPRDFARFRKMMIEVFYPVNETFLFGRHGAAAGVSSIFVGDRGLGVVP